MGSLRNQHLNTVGSRLTQVPPAALVLLVLGAACGVLAHGATADEALVRAVRACADVDDDGERLRCFDAAVAGEPAGAASAAAAPLPANRASPPPVPSTPADASTAAAAADPAPADQAPTGAADATAAFGLDQRPTAEQETRDAPLRELQAVVVGVDRRRDGLLTLTLDNGQVWRQKSVTSLFRVREGDTVTIRRGNFGGYTLIAPGRRSTAVSRLQ